MSMISIEQRYHHRLAGFKPLTLFGRYRPYQRRQEPN